LNLNKKDFSNDQIKPVKNSNQTLPPSSLHAFLRADFEIGGVTIADHEQEYKNKFYHSVFDTPDNLNITFPENITELQAYNYTTKFASTLQPLLTSIAKSVYSLGSLNASLDDQVDLLTLNKLVYCFYKNSTCSFFKSLLTEDEWKVYNSLLDSTLPKQRLSFYTSVYDNKISGKWISFLLLRYFSRNTLLEKFNVTECKKGSESFKDVVNKFNLTIKSLAYVNKTTCIASSVYGVSSVSPAFENVNDGYLVNIDKFSAWTESSWASNPIQMKIFMFTSDSIKTTTIVLGIMTLLISTVITFLINKYSSKLLPTKTQEQTDQD
jgi:nicastrin